MSTYGKALGTFRRVNKIRQSQMKIGEAQNMLAEKQYKAREEARKIANRQGLFNSVANMAMTAGAAYMSGNDNITPETASKISTVASGALSVGSNLIGQGGSSLDGLSNREYDYFRSNTESDVASDMMRGYTMQEIFNDLRREKEFAEFKNAYNPGEDDLTMDQMTPYMNEVNFVKGSGYDFSQLPELARRGIERYRRGGI